MVAGNWLNYDGLYLQFGTQKAVPELGGEYLMYGPWRELEAFISPGVLSISSPSGANSSVALPVNFTGTISSQDANHGTGIISYTTFFPLQATAPVTAASGSVLSIINPQLWIDQVDFETFVAWSAGGGSGTGIIGVGLVVALPANGTNPPSWAQVTPNAGVQLMNAVTIANSQLALGRHWTYYADGSALELLTPPATEINTNYPTGGSWLGNVPLTTLSETFLPGGLPNNAYLSVLVTGGQFTQATAGGLSSIRVKYRQMYSINDATQI